MNRRAILTRDNQTCGYCGRHATTIDHIIPRSKGGQHTWANLVACCKGCNHKKADRLLTELEWKLHVTPHAPSGSFWMIIGQRLLPDWLTYLGLDTPAVAS